MAVVVSNIQETVREIEALSRLMPDWDGEGGVPPTHKAVEAAKQIVQSAARISDQKGAAWRDPRCGASGDGGIDLSWKSDAASLLLIVSPHQAETVVCVWKPRGDRATRQVESQGDAVSRILDGEPGRGDRHCACVGR